MRRWWSLLLTLVFMNTSASALPNVTVIEVRQPDGLTCIDPSQQYTGHATVKNDGDTATGPTITRVNMWAQPYLVETPALAPGATHEVQVTSSTFDPIGCPDYTIKASADWTDVVVESNESDNTLFAPYVLKLCSCLPSPTPTNTGMPTATNTTVANTATPTNTGAATPTNTTVPLPTPTNTTVAPAATPTRTNTTVPPAATATRTNTTVPVSTATRTQTQQSCGACALRITSVTHEEVEVGGDLRFTFRITNTCDGPFQCEFTEFLCALVGPDAYELDPPLPRDTVIPGGGYYELVSIAQRVIFECSGCVTVHFCFCDLPCVPSVTHEVCFESPTPTPSASATDTAIPTSTKTASATRTGTRTRTPTPTNTGAPTATSTGTATNSRTPTDTHTPVSTRTPSSTRTETATKTLTSVPTATATGTNTNDPTATPTNTAGGEANLIVIEVDQPYGLTCIDPSQTYVGHAFVKNDGGTTAGESITRLNMWGQPHFVDTPALAPGEIREVTVTSGTFEPIGCPDYTIKASADWTGVVAESNESDNTLFAPYTLTLCGCGVLPTNTATEVSPTDTPTEMPSETATATNSPIASRTHTASPTSTRTRTASPTPTRTETGMPTATRTLSPMPTATPTNTMEGFCDSGGYEMTVFGDIIRLGSPPNIAGSLDLHFPVAKDLEKARAKNGADDLVVLTGDGVVSFVQDPWSNINQEFLFSYSSAFPMGRAVDMEMSSTSHGFWVLTDFGGIYRAGDCLPSGEGAAVPGTLGFPLGYDVLFGNMRDPNVANPGGASLRAVSLVVIETTGDSLAEGYVILDSQGGHYQLNPDGSPVEAGTYAGAPHGSPLKLLDPEAYEWPFFAGLDIARDAELHSSQRGLVVLDGWDGIHPVPVNDPSNPVFYTRNEDPAHPGMLLTTVGMPYIIAGFDNPETVQDESNPLLFGIDAQSIFVDFEFSAGCPQGFYTLDKFGGIFAFGDTRANSDSLTPNFPSPWFYPYLYAQAIEFYGRSK